MTASPSMTNCLYLFFRRGLDDPGLALAPVITAARDQAYPMPPAGS